MKRHIEWWRPEMSGRELGLIEQVLKSRFLNDGPRTEQFEREVARMMNVPFAVATTSGTSAIFLGLAACGIGYGDEVLVPNVTFIATANAVCQTGAKPVLVDVDPRTFCIDVSKIRSSITKATKAIVPVHVSGRSADMDGILAIAKEFHLRVVEDAAEAFGSSKNHIPLGTLGDVGCYSFTANKMITTGQGGMVVTRDPNIHQRLRELKDQGRPQRGTGGADLIVSIGYNFKFTDLQAAVALEQLREIPQRIAHQTHMYHAYVQKLSELEEICIPKFYTEEGECPIWVDASVPDRDGLCEYLLNAGIDTRKYWYPIHTQAPYRTSDQQFPVSDRICGSSLWLPSPFYLTDEEIDIVCKEIKQWLCQVKK